MNEESERTRIRNEDILLERLVKVISENASNREQAARVDERTTHLTTALGELKRLHETGTRDVTNGLLAVQKANENETGKVLAAMKDHMADDKASFDAHNTRLNSLENWRSNMTGKIAAAAVICGAASGLVFWLLNKFF